MILYPTMEMVRYGPSENRSPVLRMLTPRDWYDGPVLVTLALDPGPGEWWDDLYRLLMGYSDYESYLGWWKIRSGVLGNPTLHTGDEFFVAYWADAEEWVMENLEMTGAYLVQPKPGVVGYWSAKRDADVGIFQRSCPTCGR